jgi:hypothetical protein
MKLAFFVLMLLGCELGASESFDDLQRFSKICLASIEFEMMDYDDSKVDEVTLDYHLGYLKGKKTVYERIVKASDKKDSSEDEPYSESCAEPRFFYNGHLWRAILVDHHRDCPCYK